MRDLQAESRIKQRIMQLTFTCLKLIIETLEKGVRRRSGIFIVNFEHISHLCLVFLLFTLSK